MVDVSDKDVTARSHSRRFLYVSEDVIRQISESKIAKGDVFAVARVAGIQGAKRCADLILLSPIGTVKGGYKLRHSGRPKSNSSHLLLR